MKKFLLNLYYWPVFIFITLVGLLVLPFILLVNVLFLSRNVGAALRRAIRFYGWVLVCLVPFFGPVRVASAAGQRPALSSLPRPAIFVANHNSAIDPYLFGALAIENSFVTSWPFKIPVYNIFMRLAGYANADEGWEEVRKKGMALLAAGSSLTIWPEGHRSRDGLLGRFKKGAFSLAVETGVPVVPVCILGSAKILPPGQRLLGPGQVRLILLDPVYPPVPEEVEGGRKNDELQEQAKKLRSKVHGVMEQALQENNHFKICSSA